MQTGIGRLLQLEKGDRPRIASLLAQAMGVGVFVGVLEITVLVVFLDVHGVERIPMALMLSGLAGILVPPSSFTVAAGKPGCFT
ncbi:MAG: hypothetical protein R2751_14175 [Bacteroidales bacterium]